MPCADNGLLRLDNLFTADACWGIKPAINKPKQSPLAMFITSERMLTEVWSCGVAKSRSPIFFLFILISCLDSLLRGGCLHKRAGVRSMLITLLFAWTLRWHVKCRRCLGLPDNLYRFNHLLLWFYCDLFGLDRLCLAGHHNLPDNLNRSWRSRHYNRLFLFRRRLGWRYSRGGSRWAFNACSAGCANRAGYAVSSGNTLNSLSSFRTGQSG